MMHDKFPYTYEDYPPLMTYEQACDALEINLYGLYELIDNDLIKVYRDGTDLKVLRSSLTAFMWDEVESVFDPPGRKSIWV